MCLFECEEEHVVIAVDRQQKRSEERETRMVAVLDESMFVAVKWVDHLRCNSMLPHSLHAAPIINEMKKRELWHALIDEVVIKLVS